MNEWENPFGVRDEVGFESAMTDACAYVYSGMYYSPGLFWSG